MKERRLPVGKRSAQHETARPPRAASPRLHTHTHGPHRRPPGGLGGRRTPVPPPPPPRSTTQPLRADPGCLSRSDRGTLPRTLRLFPGSRHTARGADSPAGTRCQVGPQPAARGSGGARGGGAVRAALGGDARAVPARCPQSPPRSAAQVRPAALLPAFPRD